MSDPLWHEFVPGDESTYPPEKDFYWATWKNGRVERQHFDLDSGFVNMLWQYCTHWAPIIPPFSPNAMMNEVGVEGDLFNPHQRNVNCAKAGCIPIKVE